MRKLRHVDHKKIVRARQILAQWQTEKSKEVVKALLKEIIPRFGLPRTFQSDNGPAFTAALIKRVEWLSKLGGSYILHGYHSPEEKQNDVIKS